MADTLIQISPDEVEWEGRDEQPRLDFEQEPLDALAASIKQHGVLQPILVRATPGEAKPYRLVDGERRLRASQQAKVKTIPAYVRDRNGKEATDAGVLALIANMEREDLNPVEEGVAFKKLVDADKGAMPQRVKRLAQKVGRSTQYVEARVALATLPDEAKQAVIDGRLKLTDAVALAEFNAAAPDLAALLVRAGHADRIDSWAISTALEQAAMTSGGYAPCEACEETGEAWDDAAEETGEPGVCLTCEGTGKVKLADGDGGVIPFAVPVGDHGRGLSFHVLGAMLTDEQQEKAEAILADFPEGDTVSHLRSVKLPKAVQDAARAYGCLIEGSRDGWNGWAYVTDREWAWEHVEKALAARVKEAVKYAKSYGSRNTGTTQSPGQAAPQISGEQREKARQANLAVGRDLQKKLAEVPVTVEAMKALAAVVLASDEGLGLRWAVVDEQQQEPRTTKSGAPKLAGYPRKDEARVTLWERIARQTTPEAVLGVLVQALAVDVRTDGSDPLVRVEKDAMNSQTWIYAGHTFTVRSLTGYNADPALAKRDTTGEAFRKWIVGAVKKAKVKSAAQRLTD